jgi:hypothetical protein
MILEVDSAAFVSAGRARTKEVGSAGSSHADI